LAHLGGQEVTVRYLLAELLQLQHADVQVHVLVQEESEGENRDRRQRRHHRDDGIVDVEFPSG
jgi:hypothetical protein